MDKKIYVFAVVLLLTFLVVGGAAADGNVVQPNSWTNGYNYNYGCTQWCGTSCCYPSTVPVYARDCAAFVADLNYADGTYVTPGTSFVKSWRIRNNGGTTWNQNYRVVFVSGTNMASTSAVYLPTVVYPGQTVDISIPMTAPSSSGSFQGKWMLQNDRGQNFGIGANCNTAFWVQICTYVRQPVYNPCPQPYYCNPYPCYNDYCQRPQPQPWPQPGTGTNPWQNWWWNEW